MCDPLHGGTLADFPIPIRPTLARTPGSVPEWPTIHQQAAPAQRFVESNAHYQIVIETLGQAR